MRSHAALSIHPARMPPRRTPRTATKRSAWAITARTILFVDTRAELGRIEILLRAIAIAIWCFVGAPHVSSVLRAHPSDPRAYVGTLVWLAYGVAFCATGVRRLPTPWAAALLGVQTAAAFALPHVGIPGFEGLLLAIVATEAPTVLSARASLAWALAQLALLFVAVIHRELPRDAIGIMGAYTAFTAFALAVIQLREREVRARRELARVHGELLATQGLLADSTRLGERLRISRELHDTLGHHLAALSIQLDLASRTAEGKAADAVRESHSMSRRMLGEVRSVVSTMRTEASIDLAGALRALADAIPSPVVHTHVSDDLRVSDPSRAHAIFRCAQEALTNAVKHASARNVWIAITDRDEGVELEVRDDGRGAGEIRPGGGIAGMRERMNELGGRVSYGAADGGGFRVCCWLPRAGGAT